MLNIIKHDIDLSLYETENLLSTEHEACEHVLGGHITLEYSVNNDCGKGVHNIEISVYDFDKLDGEEIEVALGLMFDAFCILAKDCAISYREEARLQVDGHNLSRRCGAMLLMVNKDLNDSVYIETDVVNGKLVINAMR